MGGAVSCCRAEAQETSQGSDSDGHPDPFEIADRRPQTTAGELGGAPMRQGKQRTSAHRNEGVGGKYSVRGQKEGIWNPRTERSGRNFMSYRALFRDNF